MHKRQQEQQQQPTTYDTAAFHKLRERVAWALAADMPGLYVYGSKSLNPVQVDALTRELTGLASCDLDTAAERLGDWLAARSVWTYGTTGRGPVWARRVRQLVRSVQR